MAAADDTLARQLGVAPRVIAAARRDLKEGLHWTQDERGRVEWLPAGVDALRAFLGLPASEKEGVGAATLDPARLLGWAAPAAPETPAPAQPIELSAKICRLMPNPCFVAVDLEGIATPVRVRASARLTVGKTLRIRVNGDRSLTCISPPFTP